MIICEFVQIAYNTARCIRCGNTIQILDGMEGFPAFPCRSEISEAFKNSSVDTSIIKKHTSNRDVSTYDANLEQCSEQQIQERYNICRTCEYFDNNTCSQCGCVLSRDKVFFNKLLWKNESCPEQKW